MGQKQSGGFGANSAAAGAPGARSSAGAPGGGAGAVAAAARPAPPQAAIVAQTGRWSFVRGSPPLELLDLPSSAPKRFHTRSTIAVPDASAATNVYPCFRGGLLFRIVDPRDKSWHFYNDTGDMEMHIEYHFGPGSRVEVTRHVDHCGPSPLPGTEGWIVVTMALFPGETLRFIGPSKLNGFRSVYRIAPLSDRVAQRQQAAIQAAVARLQDEMEVVAKLTAEMDAPTEENVVERCARQQVPFVDLGFRPVAEALFGPAAGSLGRFFPGPDKSSTIQRASQHSRSANKRRRVGVGMNSLSAAHTMAEQEQKRQSFTAADRAATPDEQQRWGRNADNETPASMMMMMMMAPTAGGGVVGGGGASAAAGSGDALEAYDGDARDLHRRLPPVVWLRPTQYLPPEEAAAVCCISQPISVYDLELGFLGDTWLLSAIAALAEAPEWIAFLFRDSFRPQRPEQAVGAYRVSLNIDGWWTTMILDDYVPCIGGRPAFASNRAERRDLWPPLLQKAFAKVYGCYAALSTGDPLLAWRSLTGCPTWRFTERWQRAVQVAERERERQREDELLRFGGVELPAAAAVASSQGKMSAAGAGGAAGTEVDEELCEQLMRYLSDGYLVCLNSRGVDATFSHDLSDSNQQACQELLFQYESVGLAMGMAYTVLACKYFPQWKLFLFKLRNPFANSGAASASSPSSPRSGGGAAAQGGDGGANNNNSDGGGGGSSRGSWNGNWSLDSDMWGRFPEVALECKHNIARVPPAATADTLRVQQQLLSCVDPEEEAGAVFWMSWEDCLRFFSGGGVCFWRNPLSATVDHRVMGHFVDSLSNVCIELHVSRPTRIAVTLSQNDAMGRDSAGSLAAIMLSIAEPILPPAADPAAAAKENSGAAAAKKPIPPFYEVKWNSTTDPMHPSPEFTFTFARDLGIVLELQPRSRPYIVVPRVFDAGVNRPYVISLQSSALAGSPGSTFDARFVHISGTSDFFLNRRVVCHPRRILSRPAKAAFQVKTSRGVLEGVDTRFDVRNAQPDDGGRFFAQNNRQFPNSGIFAPPPAAAAPASAVPQAVGARAATPTSAVTAAKPPATPVSLNATPTSAGLAPPQSKPATGGQPRAKPLEFL